MANQSRQILQSVYEGFKIFLKELDQTIGQLVQQTIDVLEEVYSEK
ncbi:MAG: hypothetical protein WD059_03025 [Balneolaceae bacterium]